MDNDKLRRGKPTVHEIYSKYFNNKHLGTSLAIICGDLAYSLAMEVLMDLDIDNEKKIEAAKILSRVLNKVSFGQELDIVSSHEKYVGEEEIALIHKLKTAMYTFDASLKIGATIAGANESEIQRLNRYSLLLGH